MRMCWLSAVIGLCYGICAPAFGAVYQLPLNDLVGVYSTGEPTLDWGPSQRTATFDFGFGFERVDSIRIHVTGTIAPALEPGGPITTPTGPVSVFPTIALRIRSVDQPDTGRGFLLGGQAFDMEVDVTPLRYDAQTAMWRPIGEFLRQGQGEVSLSLEPVFSGQIVPALGGIADAYLVIDGVAVPEPSCGWLAGAGFVAFLAKRIRRRVRGVTR